MQAGTRRATLTAIDDAAGSGVAFVNYTINDGPFQRYATVVRNKLTDFIDVCRKRLPADPASTLIADAQYILTRL